MRLIGLAPLQTQQSQQPSEQIANTDCPFKDCSSKFRSKHSSNTIMCLLQNLLEQSLGCLILKHIQAFSDEVKGIFNPYVL